VNTIWQLSANYVAIDAKGYCNGYPVFDIDIADEGAGGTLTAALNPYLIGAGNELRIEITKVGDGAKLSCNVEAAQAGDMVNTGEATPLEIPAGDPPHVIIQTFDSTVSGFGDLLAQAQPATGAAMCQFALEIRDVLNAGDLDAVMAMFRPKFDAYSEAFGQPLEEQLEGIRGMFTEVMKHTQEFDVEDLDVKPYCGDKLWDLRRKDGGALIRIEEEDGATYIDVCAAMLPDGPAVVR
jgi:hypothetical protein